MVDFDPTIGQEMQKTRPAVVVNVTNVGRAGLRIVVPITGWQEHYHTQGYWWLIKLPMDSLNQLSKDSAADAYQVKAVAVERFRNRRGEVSTEQLDGIAAAVAVCVGYRTKPNP